MILLSEDGLPSSALLERMHIAEWHLYLRQCRWRQRIQQLFMVNLLYILSRRGDNLILNHQISVRPCRVGTWLTDLSGWKGTFARTPRELSLNLTCPGRKA